MTKRVYMEQINEATNTFKAYEITMTQKADGWAVSGWNGRIGKTLKEQPKGTGLTEEAAEAMFDALLRGQMKKGYAPKSGDVPASDASAASGQRAEVDPDLLPALPTALPSGADSIEDLRLNPSEWLAQIKRDGENRPVRATPDEVVFANRSGQRVPGTGALRAQMLELASRAGEPLRMDTEDMGAEGVFVFDLVEGLGVSRSSPFAQRNEGLAKLAGLAEGLPLIRVDVAVPLGEMLANGGRGALRDSHEEGIVAKRASAPYAPGRVRNAKTADIIKDKFVEDATFRIADSRKPGLRSVGIESWDDEAGAWVRKGNVTIPANADIPEPGTFADVHYLYAHAGGGVIQPVWKRAREGVGPEDCSVSKLKLKAAPIVTGPEPQDEEDRPGM